MYNNDSNSLNAGAYANLPQQDIRLSGDHHPTNTQQNSGIMAAGPRGTYTQRRKQNMAYGGIAGLDGRKAYGIGSWFQEKIKDPIAKLIPNELKNPAAAIVGGSLLDKYGLPDFLPGDLGQFGEGWLGKTAEAIGDVPYVGKVLGPVAEGVQKVGETIGNIPSQIGSIFTGDENKNKEIENIFKIPESERTIEQKLAIEAWEKLTQSGTGSTGSGIMDTLFGANEQGVNYKIPMAIGAAAGEYQRQYLKDQPKFAEDTTGINFQTARQAMDDPNLRFKPKAQYADMAQGGRIGYSDGGSHKAWLSSKGYDDMMIGMSGDEIIKLYDSVKGTWSKAHGGRIGADEGGLMNLGGMEKDYRQEGGFVPLGGEEKADDVPARLSKNEFVFTADAVRAAGGGDIDQGAEVMENLMENLESGGEVSEDSQGLEGARGMFANAQQLEKRII